MSDSIQIIYRSNAFVYYMYNFAKAISLGYNQSFGKVAEAVSYSCLELKEVGRSDCMSDPFELAEVAGLNS